MLLRSPPTNIACPTLSYSNRRNVVRGTAEFRPVRCWRRRAGRDEDDIALRGQKPLKRMRLPSPKNCPGSRIPTTDSLPRQQISALLRAPEVRACRNVACPCADFTPPRD
jgi:hypothetical protein